MRYEYKERAITNIAAQNAIVWDLAEEISWPRLSA